MLFALLGLASCQKMMVTVEGEAEAELQEEDRLHVEVLVQNTQYTLSQALAHNERVLSKVKEILKNGGIKAKSIEVTKFKVRPFYTLVRKENIFNGLAVSQSLAFDCKETQIRDGQLIDQLIEAGVQRVSSVEWAQSEENEDASQSKVYQDALDDAWGKAQSLCGQSGFQVRGVQEIEQVREEEDQEQQQDNSPIDPKEVVKLKAVFVCLRRKKGNQQL